MVKPLLCTAVMRGGMEAESNSPKLYNYYTLRIQSLNPAHHGLSP